MQFVEQLPSRYHCASGCRLARLGLRVMVAVKVADPPSEAKTGPNLSTKVMLIFVYSILGSMAAEAAEGETDKDGQEQRALAGCECMLLPALSHIANPNCISCVLAKLCLQLVHMCVAHL